MFTDGFKKITPLNGFSTDKGNARQNDYAWAVDELGDYLYVGTGRNIPNLAFEGLGLPIPNAFMPNDDYRAEIWRLKKDGGTDWEQDFKTGEQSFGFRFMIQYPRTGHATPALYAAATSSDGNKAVIYRRTQQSSWTEFARLEGGSSRSMVEHLGRLYVATVPLASSDEVPRLYVLNEVQTAFESVSLPAEITGEITSMLSFNNRLYIGLAKTGGLDVWRTKGAEPCSGWKLVVDKGAGDAINIIPFVMDQNDDSIYLGTGMVPFLPLLTGLPVITKGFDIVQIRKDDTWKVVVGGLPAVKTKPVTGRRNLSIYPSGFGNPFNAYCWQVRSYNGTLYAGSFDWSVVIRPALQSLFEAIFKNQEDALLNLEDEIENAIGTLPQLKVSVVRSLLKKLFKDQGDMMQKAEDEFEKKFGSLPHVKLSSLHLLIKELCENHAGIMGKIEDEIEKAIGSLPHVKLSALLSLFKEVFRHQSDIMKNFEEAFEKAADFAGSLPHFKSPVPCLTSGFDLWKSCRGGIWLPVSLNGFNNPGNYGVRNLFPSENGNLYLGTANPFQGCEVWEKSSINPGHLFIQTKLKSLEELHSDLKRIYKVKKSIMKLWK